MVRTIRGRGRIGRVRRGGGRNTTITSAVRRILSAPRERVRPRQFVRTRSGHGSVTLSPIRNLVMFAKKIQSGTGPADTWWIEGLKTFAWIVMQLITVALGDEALEAHRRLSGVPAEYTAGSSVVGCVQTMLLGPEDLLAQTQIVRTDSNNRVTINYRQGRLMHIRVIVTPTADISNRAGMIAGAILPLTESEVRDLIANSGEVKTSYTFDEVVRLPKAVVKTALAPFSVVYSPKVGDYGYQWNGLGDQLGGARALPGTCCKFVFAYQDMTSNTSDVSPEYSLTQGQFNITLDGTVQVREISDQRVIPPKPYTGLKAEHILVCAYARQYMVPLNRCLFKNGVLYHHEGDDIEPQALSSVESFMPVSPETADSQ